VPSPESSSANDVLLFDRNGLRLRFQAEPDGARSAHRFLHERADPCLFGGGQLLQREGGRPHGAFVNPFDFFLPIAVVVLADFCVPFFAGFLFWVEELAMVTPEVVVTSTRLRGI
jgi:hypothetical protein